MHSEHLNNVRASYVGWGWLVAIASASLFVLVFIALGVLDIESSTGGRWIAIAVTLGFFAGGAFVGFMVALAPILHGILIGLTSLVVWALVNGIVSAFFPEFTWNTLNGPLTVNVILVQMVGAVLGARLGYRYAVARN
jgi:hypothetical protein